MNEDGSVPGDAAQGTTLRRALGIGITGHRPERLEGSDLEALQATIGALLDTLRKLGSNGHAIDLRLISALAEGADSMAADAALARGWTLDVVLPFARDVYAQDFAEGGIRDEHLARIDRAHAVFELEGKRDEGGDGAAYELAGRVVLAQADLLIAIWDGGPVRGRGGAAQVVAEAVLQGIPVIQIHPAGKQLPCLLWQGFEEVDIGQQTLESVTRHDLLRLGRLLEELLGDPRSLQQLTSRTKRRWAVPGLAFPLLLAVMGIRRPRLSDAGFARPVGPEGLASCAADRHFSARLANLLVPRFAEADAIASRSASLLRSGHVRNFALSSFAVVLSMFGLALPSSAKPYLLALEFATIATILLATRVGNKADWHGRWLDHRALSERLRCIALSAQLGDLDLRGGGATTARWVVVITNATARALGLPNVRAGQRYLSCVRDELFSLIGSQLAYLTLEGRRMNGLDHRLHLLGTTLFATTALACLSILLFKGLERLSGWTEEGAAVLSLGATIASAVLPAIGAAIYGIRMQGDFAGTAERNAVLCEQLRTIHGVIGDDDLSFELLSRRVRRTADLLTGDLDRWLEATAVRRLTLPG